MLQKMSERKALFFFLLWLLLLGFASSPWYREYKTKKAFSFGIYELSFLKKEMISFMSHHNKCPNISSGGGYPLIHAGRPSHVFDTYQILPLSSDLPLNLLLEKPEQQEGDFSCLLIARFKSDLATGQIPEALRGKLIRYILHYDQKGIRYSCYSNVDTQYSSENCEFY